jgi:hypothetical protein
VPQPRRHEHQRRVTVGEGAHHAGASPDLADDPLERIGRSVASRPQRPRPPLKKAKETLRHRFASGNAFELCVPHEFDAVLITEIIEHVAHPDRFLAQVARLGAARRVRRDDHSERSLFQDFRNKLPRFSECPDPSIYESVQFMPDADGHIFLLHADEVRQLAGKAGLKVERMELFTNPYERAHEAQLRTQAASPLARCANRALDGSSTALARRTSDGAHGRAAAKAC